VEERAEVEVDPSVEEGRRLDRRVAAGEADAALGAIADTRKRAHRHRMGNHALAATAELRLVGVRADDCHGGACRQGEDAVVLQQD